MTYHRLCYRYIIKCTNFIVLPPSAHWHGSTRVTYYAYTIYSTNVYIVPLYKKRLLFYSTQPQQYFKYVFNRRKRKTWKCIIWINYSFVVVTFHFATCDVAWEIWYSKQTNEWPRRETTSLILPTRMHAPVRNGERRNFSKYKATLVCHTDNRVKVSIIETFKKKHIS